MSLAFLTASTCSVTLSSPTEEVGSVERKADGSSWCNAVDSCEIGSCSLTKVDVCVSFCKVDDCVGFTDFGSGGKSSWKSTSMKEGS